MILVIKDGYGKILEKLNVTVYPVTGQTVTTEKGVYEICESGIDYTTNEYIVYSEEFDERD